MKNKVLKIILFTFISITMLFSATTANTATVDEAVISPQTEELVPLYTTSPDSSLKEYKSYEMTSRDYRIFYAQTTFLALLAGYLILFKTRNKKKSEDSDD